MTILQPIIDQVAGHLLDMIGGLVAVLLAILTKYAINFIAAHTTEKNRKILYQFAGEAFAWARKEYEDNGGPAKLQGAVLYVREQLRDNKTIKINLTDDVIKAAIEQAILEYKAKVNTTTVVQPPVTETPSVPVTPTTAQILTHVAQALLSASEPPVIAKEIEQNVSA
jgi:LL-H family phage holin